MDREELLRTVERVRIEMVYARAALRLYLPPLKPGDPDLDDDAIINRVGVSLSKINDAIRETENLIVILR